MLGSWPPSIVHPIPPSRAVYLIGLVAIVLCAVTLAALVVACILAVFRYTVRREFRQLREGLAPPDDTGRA